ncbi:MAG TPA: hypothetical protein VIG49_07590, partial [Acetobacteraceae bacterium]
MTRVFVPRDAAALALGADAVAAALEQIAGERNARRRESAVQNKEPEHFVADTQPENALVDQATIVRTGSR